MKSRLNVVSLLSVFLLLFAIGGVASADNAASISVAISYPCEQGEACDETGVAVSRSLGLTADGGPGDDVNIYITLLDANGNPATAGANGEDLDGSDCPCDIPARRRCCSRTLFCRLLYKLPLPLMATLQPVPTLTTPTPNLVWTLSVWISSAALFPFTARRR